MRVHRNGEVVQEVHPGFVVTLGYFKSFALLSR